MPSRALLAAPMGELGHGGESAERVALHLDDGDRTLGRAPIVVKHRIVAVFPSLVHQAARARRVSEKAISVCIAGTFDPPHRRLERGPETVDESKVAGARRVSAREHDEE